MTESERARFEVELEFVQALGSPVYLQCAPNPPLWPTQRLRLTPVAQTSPRAGT
jgi:hypothetical protein